MKIKKDDFARFKVNFVMESMAIMSGKPNDVFWAHSVAINGKYQGMPIVYSRCMFSKETKTFGGENKFICERFGPLLLVDLEVLNEKDDLFGSFNVLMFNCFLGSYEGNNRNTCKIMETIKFMELDWKMQCV